jgi:hypothetical protein
MMYNGLFSGSLNSLSTKIISPNIQMDYNLRPSLSTPPLKGRNESNRGLKKATNNKQKTWRSECLIFLSMSLSVPCTCSQSPPFGMTQATTDTCTTTITTTITSTPLPTTTTITIPTPTYTVGGRPRRPLPPPTPPGQRPEVKNHRRARGRAATRPSTTTTNRPRPEASPEVLPPIKAHAAPLSQTPLLSVPSVCPSPPSFVVQQHTRHETKSFFIYIDIYIYW